MPIIELIAMYSQSADDINSAANDLMKAAKEHSDLYFEGLAHHYRGYALKKYGKSPESIAEHLLAIEVFKRIDRKDKVARQYLNLGNRYADIGMYDSALSMYSRGEVLAKEVKDTMAIYGAEVNISTIHHDRGDREMELEYLFRAKTLVQGIGDPDQIALMNYNIAVFYMESGEMYKSAELALEAYETYSKTGNALGRAGVHTLWSEMHFESGRPDSALIELDSAIKLYAMAGDKNRVGLILMNQGAILSKLDRRESGFKKLLAAHEIFKETGDKRFTAKTYIAMAEYAMEEGELKKSIAYAKKAVEIGEEIWIRADLIEWTKSLADLYVMDNQLKNAFEMLERHGALKDSLNAENSHEAVAEMEARYQTEKKQLEIENLKHESSLQEIELEHEQNRRMWVTIGLLLTLILVVIVGFALVQKRRDNKLISAQKEEVEAQNEKIEYQRLVMEEKNREITDSITYAKRIQDAILPDASYWNHNLPNSFVLYKPKDIVAGDFYWMENVNVSNEEVVLFAAADCTGHGVPGALVSVVCHNALTRSVKEFGLNEPAQILDKTRDLVIDTFKSRYDNKEATIKDGMDIAICAYNPKKRTVTYAGAQNPMWIASKHEYDLSTRLEKEGVKLFEIKADKQPIGDFELSKKFSQTTVELQEGDSVYLFSDGYSDQFGGERGKKFKQASMRDLLLNIQDKKMEHQHDVLWQNISDWMGDLEQVDDICVIGWKV